MSRGGARRRRAEGADLLDWAVAVGRLTCAVSLSAAEQLGAAFRGERRRAEANLDDLCDVGQEAFDGRWRDLFRVGEQVARGGVETTARLIAETRGGSLDPERLARRAGEVLARGFDRRRPRTRRPVTDDDDPPEADD